MENGPRVCTPDDIPSLDGRMLIGPGSDIARFRARGGPLRGWNIDLACGEARASVR
ncbi:hypothetical protein [Chromobacterium sp. CV08]|uniref:hypothetical protein n=1 Tax=Chromobacterium sp. CV08 TaxID=3133274 RepID=UPI003DA82C3B